VVTSRPHPLAWLKIPAAILLLLGGCVLCLTPMSTPRSGTRTQTLNNLRNVAIATQAYATIYDGWIPAGGKPEDTSPEWSWQTQLLPYLEQQAAYGAIDFTRAWNSPENGKPLSMSLAIFYSAVETNRRPVDGFGVTHFTANSRLFGPREGVRIDDVANMDGTTATIMMGEIGSGFPPWARPGNCRDPARGLGGGPDQFGNSQGTPCAVMFLGGNGRHLDPRLSPRVLELLADPDNGVPADDEF
jgi:hypothetical protein